MLSRLSDWSSQRRSSSVDIISQWISRPADELIFDSSIREIKQYMDAVDKIQQSPKDKGSDKQLKIAMARLMHEFQVVLGRRANYAAGPTSAVDCSSVIDSTAFVIRYEDYSNYDASNKLDVNYLSDIAKRASIDGCIQDCIRGYISVRKPFLQSQLKRLHFEELRIGEKNKRVVWDDLKSKFEFWIPVSKICVEIFFGREKKLCEEIFKNLGGANAAAKDECFIGTVHDSAVKLFGFVEAVSLSSQSYERMVPILGLYDAYLSFSEVSNTLFSSESGATLRNSCSKTLSGIENDVNRMLYDFENAVLRDSDDPGDNGGIHRLTEYVLDQIILLLGNEKLLKSFIKSTPSLKFDDMIFSEEDFGDINFLTFVDRHMILIIAVLEKNLESKSKKCKDPDLGNFFTMNNIHYIIQKIKASNQLQGMVSDLYMSKLSKKVELAATSYQSSISHKFLTCFRDEGLHNWLIPKRLSKTKLKERMEEFNKVFEHIQALHSSSRTIPDSLLRQNVRSSMSETLVPAYESFLYKYRGKLKLKSSEESNSIRHSAKDLKSLILEKLFENSVWKN